MDGRRARSISARLGSLPRLQRADTQRSTEVGELLRLGWAAVLGLGWPLAILIAIAIEPAPAHPHAAVPTWETVVANALLIGVFTTVFAASARLPFAAGAGSITGAIAVGMAVACPVSGHHDLGLWWFAELAIMVAMLAVSVAALGKRSREAA